jgi:colanic acid biosynthesis glycosyl transferase WcaI
MAVSGKKLLIVSQHYWPESFRINDLVQGLVEKGIDIDVLCGLPNYPEGEWFDGYSKIGPFREDHDGAHVYRCKEIPRTGNTSARIFLNYVSWPWHAVRGLHRLPGGYDAVFCFNTSPVLMAWPAIKAARRFNVPLINNVLDLWPENLYSVLEVKNTLLRKIAKSVSDWHYCRSDRIITMSAGLQNRLIDRIGFTNHKGCQESKKSYTVIPQYCEDFYDRDSEASKAECESIDSWGADLHVMFAGNISPAQSLETTLQALKKIKDGASSYRIKLTLIGDGMSKTKLESMVKELALEDCVEFYGRVEPKQIPALVRTADALLVSLSDSPDLGLTVPAKLASCMAAGKPLVVSLTGEGATVALESGGALVSPACNIDALAENILELCNMDAENRMAMGDKSYIYYKENFSREFNINRIADFIFPENGAGRSGIIR